MTDRELAAHILEERRRLAKKRPGVPYYMLNIGHPAVEVAYAKWRAAQGPHGCPPGDEERTMFELSMMSPACRALLEQHFEVIERMRGPGGPGQGPGSLEALLGGAPKKTREDERG